MGSLLLDSLLITALLSAIYWWRQSSFEQSLIFLLKLKLHDQDGEHDDDHHPGGAHGPGPV